MFESFYTPTRISVKDNAGSSGWGGFCTKSYKLKKRTKDWMNRKGAANGVAGSAAKTVGLKFSRKTQAKGTSSNWRRLPKQNCS